MKITKQQLRRIIREEANRDNQTNRGRRLSEVAMEQRRLRAQAMATAKRGGYLDMNGRDLRGADLSVLDLKYADFSDSDLSGASFEGANLNYANFTGADLTGADFTGATLEHTTFEGANVSGADFTYADRRHAARHGAIGTETAINFYDPDPFAAR